MTVFIYVLAFFTGFGIYEIAMFALKAYRRYRYNQAQKRYADLIRHHAQIGNLVALLEMKRSLKNKTWRN